MSLVKCNGCNERNEPRYTQVTTAWRRADGIRVAYRSRLCVSCFASKVAPVDKDYRGVDTLTCPNCGIVTEEDMDAIYFTCYIPSYGEHRIEAPFCPSCAVPYRAWVQEHSWQLDDQRGATGGPSTHPSADEVLRAMGIEPRAS